MHLSTRVLLPALLVMSGVLADQSPSPSNGSPDVTYPAGSDAFVFCSGQGCTGTCEVVNTDNVPRDDGEYAPNSMGFESIYWYDPGSYSWLLYTCVDYYDCDAVNIGPNTCYNLYENGAPTDFYEYWYVVDVTG